MSMGYTNTVFLESSPDAFPIEEPVAEEPVAEEPVAEEPVAEEPVAEEPVAEEPFDPLTHMLIRGRRPNSDDFAALPPLPEIESTSGDTFDPLVHLDDRVTIALLFYEVVRTEHVERAWGRWRSAGSVGPLWHVLAEDPSLDRESVYEAAAEAFAFKRSDAPRLSVLACLSEAQRTFSATAWDQMKALKLLPVAVRMEGAGRGVEASDAPRVWTFATFDPTNPEVHRVLRGLNVKLGDLHYAPESYIDDLLDEAQRSRNEPLDRVHQFDPVYTSAGSDDEGVSEEALEQEIKGSMLINLFEAALIEAVRQGASDVHVCPDADGHVGVYFRIDGDLERWHVEEAVRPEAFLAVVKDRTLNVDRFERERGQDGYLQRVIDGTTVRFRVSILPIAHVDQRDRHESAVIRVLDDRKIMADLSGLGLAPEPHRRLSEAIHQPHGMVVVTGPTGSGKSTTLYAVLREVRSPKRNVLTTEDPVEYVIPGVRQIKVGPKLPVQEALRFILRHDPDIVMVGEMRDKDTAELAIKLANTGHLTFSTLHTNDAPSAISRLYKMGLEPFLIAHAVHLVVAQRLVRLLCPHCRVEDVEREGLGRLGFDPSEVEGVTLYRSGSDPACEPCEGRGVLGRRAVVEVMPITKAIRTLIIESDGVLDDDALREQAKRDGMTTLMEVARQTVLRGEISVEEALWAVGAVDE